MQPKFICTISSHFKFYNSGQDRFESLVVAQRFGRRDGFKRLLLRTCVPPISKLNYTLAASKEEATQLVRKTWCRNVSQAAVRVLDHAAVAVWLGLWHEWRYKLESSLHS